MEEVKITISVQTFTELLNQVTEYKLLKRLLVEKNKSYGRIEHSEVNTLCILLGLEEEDEGE